MITINLTLQQWDDLKEKVYAEVPASTRLLSHKHKEALGFSVREHNGWGLVRPKDLPAQPDNTIRYLHYIALDFVDEPAATLFRLRWL
jgi:hypothetical protein